MTSAGEWIVKDPFSGDEVGRVALLTREELSATIHSAEECFSRWKKSSAYERSELLSGAANELEGRHEEFAQLIRREAGKPITYARAEVKRAIGVLRWASAEAQRYAGELLRLDAGATGRSGFGIHQRFPRGIVLGITPFNFPLNLAAHKIAPAIACGCPILIKPSPYAPLAALKFAELFRAVPGLVQIVLCDDLMTAELTRAHEIKTISFTGSAQVGWQIRRQAPEKPTTLELGGNAFVIVAEDTSEQALPGIAKRIAAAAFGYAGQSCISVQNVAAAKPIYDQLLDCLKDATESTPFGETSNPDVVCGPVIHAQAQSRIEQLLSGLPDEFELIRSKNRVDHFGKGRLISPALVLQTAAESNRIPPAAHSLVNEEIFGPVMNLAHFRDTNELVSRVSSSRYGLQAGIYTQNLALIQKLYEELQIGGLIINDVPTTRYDYQPYGGVKESGLGREGIRFAMDEMTESKFLALSSSVPL